MPEGFAGGIMKFRDDDLSVNNIHENTNNSGVEKGVLGGNSNVKQTLFVRKVDIVQDSLSETKVNTQYEKKVTKIDMSEKMKSLSDLVNKMSVKDIMNQPLSPNSNKENIPLKNFNQLKPEPITTSGSKTHEVQSISELDESLVNFSKKPADVSSFLASLANQQQTHTSACSQATSLAEPSKIQSTGKLENSLNQKPSLAELAMKHNSKTLALKPCSVLSYAVENKKEGQLCSEKPSLAHLVNKHESQSRIQKSAVLINDSVRKEDKTQKPSLAELAMKNQIQKSTVLLVDSVRKEEGMPSSVEEPSLAELAMKHESQSQIQKSAVLLADTVKKEGIQISTQKPSLAELAIKHELQAQVVKPVLPQTSVSKKTSLAELAKMQSQVNIEKIQAQSAKSSQPLSLAEFSNTNKSQSDTRSQSHAGQNKQELQVDLGEFQKQTVVSEQKASLMDLASKFQQQKEKQQAVESAHDKGNTLVAGTVKSNISLVQLAKSKNTHTNAKDSKNLKLQSKDNIISSLDRMNISDKSKDIASVEEVNVQIKKAAVDDILLDFADNLYIAQSCKLMKGASKLGKTLCLKVKLNYNQSSDSIVLRKYRTKKFSYRSQMAGRKAGTPVHTKKITPFDFLEPSPDDIVKQRQKAAFKRTGERKLSN